MTVALKERQTQTTGDHMCQIQDQNLVLLKSPQATCKSL